MKQPQGIWAVVTLAFCVSCQATVAQEDSDSEVSVEGVERADGPPLIWTARYNESRIRVLRDNEPVLSMDFSEGARVQFGEKELNLFENEEGFLTVEGSDEDLKELTAAYDATEFASLGELNERGDTANLLASLATDIGGAWDSARDFVRRDPPAQPATPSSAQETLAREQAELIRVQRRAIELQAEAVRNRLHDASQRRLGCKTQEQAGAEEARLRRVKTASSCIAHRSVQGCAAQWPYLVREGFWDGAGTGGTCWGGFFQTGWRSKD